VFDEGASLGEVHVAGRAVFVLRVHHVGPGRVGQAVGGCFGYRYGHYLNLITVQSTTRIKDYFVVGISRIRYSGWGKKDRNCRD